MDEGFQADNDMPVPLRWSLRTTRNQPPCRYWNFALLQNYTLSSTFDIWVGLCICLHIMSCLYNVFMGNTVWRHSIQATTNLPDTNNSWHWWGHHQYWLYGRFLDGGSGPKDSWPKHCCPTGEKMTTPHRDPMIVWALQPWRWCTQ